MAQRPKKKDDDPYDIEGIQYPIGFVRSMDNSYDKIAGAMGLSNIKGLTELWYDKRKCASTRKLLHDYFILKSQKFGLPTKSSSKPSADLISMAGMGKFANAIMANAVPQNGHDNVTPESLANMITLWYGVQIMKERPDLFSRSKFDQEPYQIDPHDALHAWKLLTCFYTKWSKQKTFDSRSPKSGSVHLPETGAVYVATQADNQASAPGTTGAAAEEVEEERMFGPVFAMGAPLSPGDWEAENSGCAIDLLVRDISMSVGRKPRGEGGNHEPNPMTPSERRTLARHLLYNKHPDFIRDCVLYQPENISAVAANGPNNALGPVISAADAIQSAQEVGFEHEQHRASQTNEIPGERAPVHPHTDDWVERPQASNHASAQAPEFKDACEYSRIPTKIVDGKLQAILNPRNTHHIGETTLKPWQATAVAWMMDQEAQGLGGGILGDACGLGKTLTALSLILFSARKAQIEGGEGIQHRPNLVVAPSGVIDVWIQEIDRYFGVQLTLLIFYGSPATTDHFRHKDRVAKDIDSLHERIERLDPKNVRTALTVVVSSYTTWFWRTTRPVPSSRPAESHVDDESEHHDPESDDESIGTKSLSDSDVQSLDELQQEQSDNDGEQPNEQPTKSKYKARVVYESNCSIFWGRIICDEAQKVKRIRSRTHQSIALLKRRSVWFLTATTMRNKVLDICGYLTMLDHCGPLDFVDGMPQGVPMPPGDRLTPEEPWIEWYRRWSAVNTLPPLTVERPYKLLTPAGLVRLATRGGHLTAQSGYDALPIVFRLCMLQRQMGDIVQDGQENTVVIGADIPPIRVMTIELCYSRFSQTFHDRVYTPLVEELRRCLPGPEPREQDAADDISPHGHGRIDWGVFRRLVMLGFCPKLDAFFQRARARETMSQEVRKHIAEARDRGFALFWTATTQVWQCIF